MHDETTIVSLCTMVDLGYDLKLIILDPDAAKPVRNELTWQILVLGSDNLYLASEGFRMSAHGDPASYGLEVWLYNNVSSSIVDNAWPKIKEALAICYKEYTDRHVGVEA
ncbi:MAG: hypothetical protein Q7S63_00210 [bacterium]|nr:hypothetical protein [bacterium]